MLKQPLKKVIPFSIDPTIRKHLLDNGLHIILDSCDYSSARIGEYLPRVFSLGVTVSLGAWLAVGERVVFGELEHSEAAIGE